MELSVLGWPPDGPTVELDHERFAYAGKFVMSDTGKAVAREDGIEAATAAEDSTEAATSAEDGTTTDAGSARTEGDLVAAASFSPDRTDDDVLRIRYITVRRDRRGEGVGPEIAAFVADAADERGFGTVKIAVNNPYAYEALYRAGFGFTGDETGLAELVLARPGDRSDARYREGLRRFAGRDLGDEEHAFLADRLNEGAPGDARRDRDRRP